MSTALDLTSTLGAMFIGVSVGGLLLGVTLSQTFYYFTHYKKDRFVFKAVVVFIFICDVLHQLFISHNMYEYLISHYAEPQYLVAIFWSLIAQIFMIGFEGFIVQTFFIYRIWKLSKSNWVLSGSIFILALANFVLLMVYIAKTFALADLTEIGEVTAYIQACNALSAATDVIIALTMVTLLMHSKTGFKHTDTVIMKLVIYCVNSGVLTSIAAIFTIVSILAWSTSYIYMIFYFLLGRLYANSFLATLNVRTEIRANLSHGDNSYNLSSIDGTRSNPNHTARGFTHGVGATSRSAGGVVVQIDQHMTTDESHIMSDVDLDAKYKAGL
ncbi:hypothetical protein BD626DRAFT_254848 [Schizophyllum amplum]|uniref:DUF6534 domain-containing protein n=1 Tax=Schizophyllum amplum TaxID=97359 RepID=A0A550CIG1_9AGAR|nr:hypothetical protein BD626DRAFT_254848 [Auriculariopsis ampla]